MTLIPPVGIALIVVLSWVWMAIFAYKRWLGYQWCMLIAGIVFVIAAGVSAPDAYKIIVKDGMLVNANTIITFAMAMIFARACYETGVIEALIKKTIELGGGRPFVTVCIVVAVWAFINPNVPGIAGIVIVGQIVLPVFLAMGIKRITAVRFFLIGTVIAWPWWAIYWPFYESIFGGTIYAGDYIELLGLVTVVLAIGCYVWIIWRFKSEGIPFRSSSIEKKTDETKEKEPSMVPQELAPRKKMAAWYSWIVVALPVILIAALDLDATWVFVGLLPFVLILTHPGSGRKITDYFPLIERITYQGFSDVAPIAINLIAVGWLTKAGQFPEVIEGWRGFIGPYIPAGFSIAAVAILAIISLAQPFRGPGHLFGMGAITVGAMLAVGVPPLLLLIWFMCLGVSMGCFVDPTYAYAVWSCGYVGESPVRYFHAKAYLYGWTMGLIAFIVCILVYLPQL